MKRLLFFALVAAAAWYGWKHWDSLRQPPGDEAVIANTSGHVMTRVRLDVGGEELPAKDSISVGSSTVIPFRVTRDASLHLRWAFIDRPNDYEWTGGQVTVGPLRSRHRLQISGDGGVVCTRETIAAATK